MSATLALRFDVTQEDIDAGIAYDNRRCPIARAIERRYHSVSCTPIVDHDRITIRLESVGDSARYPLTRALDQFIFAFDHGEPVKPHTFWLRGGRLVPKDED